MTKFTNNVLLNRHSHGKAVIIVVIACIVVGAVHSLRTIHPWKSSTLRWHLQGKVIRDKVSIIRSTVADGGEDTAAIEGDKGYADSSVDLKNYLEKSIPWKGRTDILKRKKQVPLPEYSPQVAVRTVLDALQINDDPQLDHGCCVLLAFKSPSGPLGESNLDPSGYGRFLRSSAYGLLIDHNRSEFIGEPEQLRDSLSVRQRVRVSGWSDGPTDSCEEVVFDFYLSNIEDTWLIDVILMVNS